jgi:PPOX class probable FMN-dependent enzyme
MVAITTHNALRERYPRPPSDRVVRKELTRLDDHCAAFIAASPFLVLATVGPGDALDASPRGDHPGFVQVADAATLLIPDRPGNNRLDSLTNLLERPRAALIFMIPGVDETLRVTGSARIDDDAGLRARFAVGGKLPATVIVVGVEQAYLHCAKAFMRSHLWDSETWPAERPVPTLGEMIRDQTDQGAVPEPQDAMLARYRADLW